MEQTIIAGFGGQGILLVGQLLAYAAMLEEKHVTWYPSYGPEQRGGTCNCSVIVSSQTIGSPVVSRATSLVMMNQVSVERFGQMLRPDGVLVYNSCLVSELPQGLPGRSIGVPANQLAEEEGDRRIGNMAALGALVAATQVVHPHSIAGAMPRVIPPRHQHLIQLNLQVFQRGREYQQ